jgi:GTP cyclohydrolase IA
MSDKILQYSNQNIPHTAEERQEIINNAANAYGQFLDALKFDWRNDPNANNTPMRVAKAYVNDIIAGCYSEPPKITAFPGESYDGMVFCGNVPFVSLCAHHNLCFSGVAHVAYLPGTQVMGLSKINRVIEFFARRPQLQESCTVQISDYISKICPDNKGVAVVLSAAHSCVSCRGVKHQNCETKTSKLTGEFLTDAATRSEFYNFISDLKK